MTALLRAELIKLRTTRMASGALVATVLLTGVGLALHLVNAGRAGTPSLGTGESAVAILSAPGWAAFVALLLGIVVVTAEYRHKTVSTALLVTPRRGQVVMAKMAAAALAGVVLALVGLGMALIVAVPTGALAAAGGNAAVATTALGVLVTLPLYALLGTAFATIVNNQTVAVAAGLLWFLIGETLLGSFGLRFVQRWTPGGATAAIAQSPEMANPLPPWVGAALLVAYALAFAGAGTFRMVRRDVA